MNSGLKQTLSVERIAAKFRLGGWDATKIFFPAFPRGLKNTSYLHFDNNNRVVRLCVIGRDENNEMELNGKHYTCEHADWIKWQATARDFSPWMAFPAKKIPKKMARIMPLSITVQRQWLKGREFYRKANFPFFRGDEPAHKHCYCVRFEKIFTSVCSFGERPSQTITFNSGFMYVLSYQRSGHENRVIAGTALRLTSLSVVAPKKIRSHRNLLHTADN